MGLCTITLLTAANQTIQLTTEATMRGRVMSIFIMFFLGATPVGAPLMGWVSDAWGPRCALVIGGLTAICAPMLAGVLARRAWGVNLTPSATLPHPPGG